MKKPASFLAATFLWIVAIAHLVRLLFRVSMTIGTAHIPLWFSVFPAIALPLIAIRLMREAKA